MFTKCTLFNHFKVGKTQIHVFLCVYLCSHLVSIVKSLQWTSPAFPWSDASFHNRFCDQKQIKTLFKKRLLLFFIHWIIPVHDSLVHRIWLKCIMAEVNLLHVMSKKEHVK